MTFVTATTRTRYHVSSEEVVLEARDEARARGRAGPPRFGRRYAAWTSTFAAGCASGAVTRSIPFRYCAETRAGSTGSGNLRHNFYLSPGASFKLRATMERLPAGVTSEPPELAPPVTAPPAGTYRTPVTPARVAVPPPAVRPAEAVGFGTLDIFVQPTSADVTIDGQRWVTSDEGYFMVQVPAGKHRVEVKKSGHRQFRTEIEVGEGQTVPLKRELDDDLVLRTVILNPS